MRWEDDELYRPVPNVVDDETGWQILAGARAGHLVTAEAGSLDATFLPFLVDVDARRVLAHVARANPQWRSADGARGLLIASGADAYVSPSSYATKRETGKVVPTWNYTVVHVHGVLRVHDDTDWLRDLVGRLTDLHERGRKEPSKRSGSSVRTARPKTSLVSSMTSPVVPPSSAPLPARCGSPRAASVLSA